MRVLEPEELKLIALATHERDQVRKVYSALVLELEQAGKRADETLERLRAWASKQREPLRLVKGGNS